MMSTNLEQAIRERLENGFKNWNGGYEGWLKWCETLYGAGCTLQYSAWRRPEALYPAGV